MPPTNYEPRLVQVPDEPGAPLVPYTAPPGTPSGTPRGARGPNFSFGDLALLVVGVVLLVWGLVAGWPGFVLVIASIITVVGLLVQVRKLAAWRRETQRRPPVVTAAADDAGTAQEAGPVALLDLADPTTARLVGAYRSLATVLTGDDGPFAEAARGAGHRALLEAAELVGGRPPTTLAQVEQLDERSAAMEALAATLRNGPALRPDPGAVADDPVAAMAGLQALVAPAP